MYVYQRSYPIATEPNQLLVIPGVATVSCVTKCVGEARNIITVMANQLP